MRKASILVITLWILALLSVLAISLAGRTMIGLQLAIYERNTTKALCIAKVGLYRALAELDNDKNNYDAATESWTDNERIFKNIKINDTQQEYAIVNYRDENNQIKYGITDEERKININAASNKKIIEQLFIKKGILADASLLSQTLDEWKSDAQEPEEEKKIFKNAPLSTPEELLAILEYAYKDRERALTTYATVKELITVHSNEKININTACEDVLTIVAYGVCNNDLEANSVPKIVGDIIALRNSKGHFSTRDDVSITTTSTEEQNLFDALMDKTAFKSSNFLIHVTGCAGDVKKSITVIYNRDSKKIVQWHEY